MGYMLRLFSKKDIKLVKENFFYFFQHESLKDFTIEEEKHNSHKLFAVRKNGVEHILIMELLPAKIRQDRHKLSRILSSLDDKRPVNAVKWVKKYLKKVKIVYAFIPVMDYEKDYNWTIFSELFIEVKAALGGIVQIKDEGFTNESGDIVVWEYPDSATGIQTMAVRKFPGIWKRFDMNLASIDQRKKFLSGKVPYKVSIRR